jgi:autotransporter strand-loop-strand O-heptosyltransferase
MFKKINVCAHMNEVTGYGIHASRFFPALDALVQKQSGGEGEVTISLLDVVTASHTTTRHPAPSILYTVWESTKYPDDFMNKLSLYDQLWVPSEWQKACSIAQGIPEEFIRVVPEGVNPDIYKPGETLNDGFFNFILVGKWEPRKSNLEICRSFLAAFPADEYPNVRLYLNCDTLFPCDNYKSTEERLEGYGLQDSRFIVIRFEQGEAYVRRLQSAHVFVSCSRAEGWGLPICESLACGVPTIVADWSGSTEYATDALLVRVPELKKPEGIYGGWNVPGKWGEPDYAHLVEVMKDAYTNYATHKAKALITSDHIRTNFSWEVAAQKAWGVLEDLYNTINTPVDIPVDNPEDTIRKFARSKGYEITAMKPRSAIFIVDSHPTTQDKLSTLIETIKQIKGLGYPLLLSAHMPLPPEVIEMADYFIYDKRDILSGEDKPIYWRTDGKGNRETTQASTPCGALAQLHNIRNSIDFCLGKYDWIYHMTYDTEIDLAAWLDKVHSSPKDMVLIKYEGNDGGVSGQIIAGKTSLMDKVFFHIPTWEEFALIYGEDRFCSERGTYKHVKEQVGLDNVEWIDIDVSNRFSSVDRNAWKDDVFQCHFVEGPYLNIAGISEKEYDVYYQIPEQGNVYQLKQKCGMWSRPSIKYYQPWTIVAYLNGELKFSHTLDLKGKNVLICMGSKALGDTISWMPYIEEFRKKRECNVICSGWWTDIFDYPEIKFVKPGSSVADIYASYDVGCFDDQLDKNVKNWRETTLQQVASDILGLEYTPIRAQLKHHLPVRGNGNPPKPYICFSEFSTMKNKLWNRDGAWQKVIDYLNSLGYECISISAERSIFNNITSHNGQLIQDTINDISGCEFYIGLNHGPAWIAYALGKPCIMLTGVSEEWNDFPNPHRVAVNNEVCGIGCFNDPSFPIDRGFEWCPRNKDYACTKEITESMVIDVIDTIRGERKKVKIAKKKTTVKSHLLQAGA